MASEPDDLGSPIAFATTWIGIAVLVSVLVGVVAGLIRGDLAGTIGPVIQWGMTIAAIGIVVALLVRRR